MPRVKMPTGEGGLVSKIRRAVPEARLLYLTPTPYDDTADVTNIPPGKTGWSVVNNKGCSVGLSLMVGFVMTQAKADGVPFVDWYTPLQSFLMGRRAKDPHFMFTRYDRTHPEALGQASGTAAALAIAEHTSVQDLPYEELRCRLVADGQVVARRDCR